MISVYLLLDLDIFIHNIFLYIITFKCFVDLIKFYYIFSF